MKNIGFIAALFIFCNVISAQSKDISFQNDVVFSISKIEIDALKNAPRADFDQNKSNGVTLRLSMPSGSVHTYYFLKNQVMSREMMDLYPNIITYNGYTTTAKQHSVSLTLMDGKIHIFILGENEKAVYIDHIEGDQYKSYYGNVIEGYTCDTDHSRLKPFMPSGARTSTNGATLKNYDFGVVITDEYESGNGGGAAAIAVAVATINDITTIYKRDLAITFTATVRPETSAFNINPSNASNVYAGTCVTAYFNQNEYDIGHVFHNLGAGFGGSGVASGAVVCSNNISGSIEKGQGWSAAGSNTGFSFMSLVSHEMGHMFSATHTFNGQADFCNQGLSITNSFEPGSGTTLMAYPGVCSSDNITDQTGSSLLNSSPYFHVRSLEQMVSFITSTSGNNCASASATNNSPPVAIANPCNAGSITIPANTPFELTGSHTDNDGDAVTYIWEQSNPGPPHGAPNIACGSTTGPIFRSYSPSTNPTRYFPSLTYILNNSNAPISTVGECLPTANRTLNFRLTVRDNNPNGGGIDVSVLQLSVSNTTGPLAVTAPNTNVTWSAGSSNTITWAGFNTSAICNTVNIKLSVDGGETFPFTLISNTTNDGSQSVTLPSNIPNSTSARIKVESSCFSCVKFFDISNVNFTISSSCMAINSNICSTEPISFPMGDPALNLNLSPIGTSFSQVSMTISAGSPIGPLANATLVNGTICQTPWGNEKYATFDFVVNQTGTYNISNTSGGQIIFSIFNAAGYNPASPCSSIFIGSNASEAISWSNQISKFLTKCNTYKLVVWTLFGANNTADINFSGPGIIYTNFSSPGPSYSYTYLAVNNQTNIVSAVSSVANFISLTSGSYSVYGASYYSGTGNNPPNVNPNTWVGQSFDILKIENACQIFTSTFKPVTILGCSTIVTSATNSGSGTLRDIVDCASAGATITFANGINPVLTSSITIDKNLTLDGNINGSNQAITTIALNFNTSYGIKINPSKVVTLKDLNVNLTGTAVPVVLNEGNLTLDNTEIKGNVNPVINNANGSTINVLNGVRIKK